MREIKQIQLDTLLHFVLKSETLPSSRSDCVAHHRVILSFSHSFTILSFALFVSCSDLVRYGWLAEAAQWSRMLHELQMKHNQDVRARPLALLAFGSCACSGFFISIVLRALTATFQLMIYLVRCRALRWW